MKNSATDQASTDETDDDIRAFFALASIYDDPNYQLLFASEKELQQMKDEMLEAAERIETFGPNADEKLPEGCICPCESASLDGPA
ncbi:MAG: hypothetical protein KDN22_21620 [Verrucomicrobiae bacterium]|nr:hypothetical protein [Verrucomicrobiae bacterium]